MKILILVPFPFYRSSGSSQAVFDMVTAISVLGYNVHILSNPFGEMVKLQNVTHDQIGFKIFKDQGPGEVLKKMLFDNILILKAISCLWKHDYNLVIGHGTMYYYFFILRSLFKVKLLATVHGNIEVELQKWGLQNNKNILNWASKIEARLLMASHHIVSIHQSVIERLNKFPFLKGRLSHIPMTSTKIPIATKESNSNKFIVLYTGTFVKIQNLRLILDTAKLMKDDIVFQLVGATDSEKKDIQKAIDDERIKNVIIFGRFNSDSLYSFYNNADVVISPRTFGHDTPTKILDYLALGMCILATNLPIHTEVLDDRNAYLVDSNPASFAEAIMFLRSNVSIRQSLQCAARKSFERNYSQEIIGRAYYELISKLIDSDKE